MKPLEVKLLEGYYWPLSDERCGPSVLRCVKDLEAKWLPHVRGRLVVVQAGGNCGVYPRELARHFAQVYTFEPDRDNFECLMRNCAGVENIHARCAALGNVEGRELSIVRKNLDNVGSHFINPRPDHGAIYDARETTVDGLKLDACDLIALDVEGYEFRALQGAARTVELFRPTIIWERKHGGRYSGDHLALPEWLKARGYTHRDTVERDEIWS